MRPSAWPSAALRWLCQYDRRVAELKAEHARRQRASTERMQARIAEYAAEARTRIAQARADAQEMARRTIEVAAHQARVAAAAKAAEYERQRVAAYQAGLEQGRKQAEIGAAFLARELERVNRAVPCIKVRLNDREHAAQMVAHVLETAGVQTEPYPCPVCPRQLFGRGRFWHVRTVADPQEQERKRKVMKGDVGREARERQLRSRLAPDQLELLRAKTRSEP